MFAELSTRQISGEPPRRWFTSSTMDLVVWLDETGRLQAFQLCYGKPRQEHALTWSNATGFAHLRVDDGSPPGLGHKNTPILLAEEGKAPDLLSLFRACTTGLPEDIVRTVQARLREYSGPHDAK